jgi:predicted enzyme related to lactoylglutathione lyase
MNIITFNTILYCRYWNDTLSFYKEGLTLPVTVTKPWFVEFAPGPAARLSIADERRTGMTSSLGRGITLTFQVDDLDATHRVLSARGLSPQPVTDHAWNARVFYVFDPEGNRIEFWSPKNSDDRK